MDPLAIACPRCRKAPGKPCPAPKGRATFGNWDAGFCQTRHQLAYATPAAPLPVLPRWTDADEARADALVARLLKLPTSPAQLSLW